MVLVSTHRHITGALFAADLNLPDFGGCTPLCLATDKGYVEPVRTLAELGADVLITNVKGCDTSNGSCFEKLFKNIVKVLAEFGADVNAADADGDIPLMKAA